MSEQLPTSVIPDGFYCFQVLKLNIAGGDVKIKICPYLDIDKNTQTKWCKFLNNMEINNIKECQINLGEL